MTSRSPAIRDTSSSLLDDARRQYLRVSFEYLDWESEEFFVHGFEAEFYARLFACLETIQCCTRDQMTKQNHPSLKCKAIFRTDTGTHDLFPSRVVEQIAAKLGSCDRSEDRHATALQIARSAFEVSMGKNQGRLHGFVWEQAFNLVWFDPAHNLYPGTHGVRKQKDLMLPRSGAHAELLRVKGEVERVRAENEQLSRDLDELMAEWAAR